MHIQYILQPRRIHYVLIPQVRPAHKYPISPWEMIHLPVGDNALCAPPYTVHTAVSTKRPMEGTSRTDGAAAQLSAARHVWEEDVQTYRTCTSVQQALKKQIIGVFEPMYLEILNDNMVGYANISARDMLDHLFKTYGNITVVDLEINFEHMRRAWDPQQPVETLFKQIQDCDDYSEAGGVPIGPSQQINVGYAKIFATG
jgi:hypothetical protein